MVKSKKKGNHRNSESKINGSNYVRIGRPNSLGKEELEKLLELYYTRPYSLRKLAGIMGVSRMTVWRNVQAAPIPMPAQKGDCI